VRLITQLLLYGEGLEDERMFEFFGQKNLLLAFCHMVGEGRKEGEREGGREESIDQSSFTDPIFNIHFC